MWQIEIQHLSWTHKAIDDPGWDWLGRKHLVLIYEIWRPTEQEPINVQITENWGGLDTCWEVEKQHGKIGCDMKPSREAKSGNSKEYMKWATMKVLEAEEVTWRIRSNRKRWMECLNLWLMYRRRGYGYWLLIEESKIVFPFCSVDSLIISSVHGGQQHSLTSYVICSKTVSYKGQPTCSVPCFQTVSRPNWVQFICLYCNSFLYLCWSLALFFFIQLCPLVCFSLLYYALLQLR